MTKLLISVRSVEEADEALAGGADLIDIKDPQRGSLGAAAPEMIKAICLQLSGKIPTSAACGELMSEELDDLAELPRDLAYVKVGLAGAMTVGDWQDRLIAAWRLVPYSIAKVAVSYVDFESCQGPLPEDVISVAAAARAPLVLFDTFDKSRGGLLSVVGVEKLDRWIERARRHQLGVVIAGSLRRNSIRAVTRRWQPDFVAVRGAACRGKRTGNVEAELVSGLRRAVMEAGTPRPTGIFEMAQQAAANGDKRQKRGEID